MEDYINIVIFQLNVVLNCNIIFNKFLDKKQNKKLQVRGFVISWILCLYPKKNLWILYFQHNI